MTNLHSKWREILLVMLVLFLWPAHGNTFPTLALNDADRDRPFTDFEFSYVPFGSHLERLTEVELSALRFDSARERLPNFGYDRGQLVVRFELTNLSSETDWILRLGNPHLKNLQLYREGIGSLDELVRTGIDEPFISRPIAFRDFWIPLKLGFQEKQTYYLLTESSQWLGLVPYLSTSASARGIQNREWALQLLGFGGIAFILLYNFFIFFVTRERVYLYYVLAGTAINIIVIPGCAGLLSYIFPGSPILAQDLWYAAAIGWIGLTALFARSFLLKNTDAIVEKKILTFSARLSAVLSLLPFFVGPNFYIALVFNVLSGIFQFVIFTIAWRSAVIRRYAPAYIFLAAWGLPIIIAMIFVGATQGLYPVSDKILYAMIFSSMWEVVCMATALGYRIVILQKEKEKTQAQLMDKAKLEGELEAARAVQEQLLPLPQTIPGLEYQAFFQPAETAGGDWYGYIYQEDQKRITFYMGDITGHGITSAVLTGVVCGAVYSSEQRSRQLAHLATPVEQLQLAAENLDSILLSTAGRTGRLMTMCFLTIDLQTGEACALNAGHTWPIFARCEGQRVVCEKIPGGGSLLGSGKHNFGIHEFKVCRGDTLLLYTDGLTENESGKGEVFTFRKIRAILGVHRPLQIQMNELELSLRALWNGCKLSDDVTFLGIRFNGLDSSAAAMGTEFSVATSCAASDFGTAGKIVSETHRNRANKLGSG